ncbi:hypothetical protein EJ06DRAFT_524435 [Trichodelitschia bisporula]|uniref:Uncharacterized protein n=1 Tax=Trichodelitschia bisporula TaxID=703511 RepID=A0A6G1HM40_9PEZI|nr:hypothetical protein EJ06DRAFT_524435 [Trichodelitschia bisporula]
MSEESAPPKANATPEETTNDPDQPHIGKRLKTSIEGSTAAAGRDAENPAGTPKSSKPSPPHPCSRAVSPVNSPSGGPVDPLSQVPRIPSHQPNPSVPGESPNEKEGDAPDVLKTGEPSEPSARRRRSYFSPPPAAAMEAFRNYMGHGAIALAAADTSAPVDTPPPTAIPTFPSVNPPPAPLIPTAADLVPTHWPFTDLLRSRWLYDRPFADAADLLIDAFRLYRAELGYSAKAEETREPFRDYLRRLWRMDEVLHLKWGFGQFRDLKKVAFGGGWSDVRRDVREGDMLARYGEHVVRQLRYFGKLVLGDEEMTELLGPVEEPESEVVMTDQQPVSGSGRVHEPDSKVVMMEPVTTDHEPMKID